MKTHRFFYHFNKHTGKMTVHFKKQCIPVDDITCLVPCETKWNKTQPRLVMKGRATEVVIIDNKAIIQ
jgi:hypothetical protein